MLYCLVFGTLSLVMGVLFFSGKALNFIAGWKQMPENERAGIRIMPLCRNIGTVIVIAGVILLIGAVSEVFLQRGLQWTMVGWIVLCIADVVYIDRSGRYTAANGVSKKTKR